MANKLTKEELDALQKSNNEQIEIKIGLGETVLVIAQAEERRDSLLEKFKEHSQNFKNFSDELKEKYGDCKIDIQTGEIQSDSPNVETDDNKGNS